MLKAIAFGVGVGLGIQALRVWPAGGPVTQQAVAVVCAVALVLAYLGGRWHGRGNSAVAVASASAHAAALSQSSVNIAFVSPGAGAAPVGVSVPSAEAGLEWFGTPRHLSSVDEVDGMELSELVEHVADPDGEAGR